MTSSRTRFFLTILAIIVVPVLASKLIWLAGSKKADGKVSFIGKRYAGQMMYTYSVIWFVAGSDTIWFNGRNGIIFNEGETVSVRYQKEDPADARLNIFLGIWGETVVYGGIPVLIWFVIFLHPAIIPYRSRVKLIRTKPYVQIA